ncbi:MAG: DUF222 domain-containing protein [Acidimicrobiales bacterium]
MSDVAVTERDGTRRPPTRVIVCALEGQSISEDCAVAETSKDRDDEVSSLEREAEIVESVRQLFFLTELSEKALVHAIVRLHDSGAWRRDGSRTLSDWLVEAFTISFSRAAALVKVALGLSSLPLLADCYEKGELSFDQLAVIVGVASKENEEFFLREAPGLSVAQLTQLARQLSSLEREETEAAYNERFLRHHWRRGRFHFRGQLGEDAGAVVEEALRRLAENAPKDPETSSYRPYPERCGDALVELCSQAIAAEQEKDADVATVICHVDAATVAGLEGEAELDGAHKIAAETARRLLCDCRFQLVRENEDGEAIGLGRTTRTVPSWLKRQLDRRDGGCRFPGCPRMIWVDRHHIVFWGQLGETEPRNLVSICRFHHRLVHEGHWRIEGDPAGEIVFISPSGERHSSSPLPPRSRRPRKDVMTRLGLWNIGVGGSPAEQDRAGP